MKIEIVIDENCYEPRLVIHTREITPEINEVVKRCAEPQPAYLIGYQDEKLEILSPDSIARIFAEQQKIYAQTDKAIFVLKTRLYEIEEKLPGNFIRISNSEIVNFDQVKNLDLSITGTICLYFHSGDKSFVSRRYLEKIRTYLGI